MSQRCHNRKSKDPGSSRRSTLLYFFLPHPTVGSEPVSEAGGAPACRHSSRRRSRLEPVHSRGWGNHDGDIEVRIAKSYPLKATKYDGLGEDRRDG